MILAKFTTAVLPPMVVGPGRTGPGLNSWGGRKSDKVAGYLKGNLTPQAGRGATSRAGGGASSGKKSWEKDGGSNSSERG